jgi:prepilin-type N-terminal cleavage/methylation domain-containing protein
MLSSLAADRGFTLIEILVVIVLMALAGLAALFWVADLSDRAAVARSADRAERELSLVARQAGASGYDATVALDTSETVPRLEMLNASVELDASVLMRWTAAAETGSSTERALITFFGVGGASGGRIEFVRGNARAIVEVDWLTAKIRRAPVDE